MDGPTIHYNIGVSAYKLGRYDRAARAFEQVAHTEAMAALAHYNLGLVAKVQGDARAARGYFERALAETQDERLQGLARAALEDATPAMSDASPIWAAFGTAGIGYDDNVTLTVNGQALGIARESDVYFDGLIAGSLQLNRNWRVDADVSLLKYSELDQFDQAGLGAGARYRIEGPRWTTDVGGQLGATYIGGDPYDRRQSLFVQTTGSLSSHWTMRARYRRSNIDGVDQYDGLDGLRHEISARLTYQSLTWAATALYLFEIDDYSAAALSATRHLVLFDARKYVNPTWTARAAVGLRSSTYEDDSIGTENRFDLSVGVDYAWTDRCLFVVQYLYTNNNADSNDFDYDRNRIQLGAEVTF